MKKIVKTGYPLLSLILTGGFAVYTLVSGFVVLLGSLHPAFLPVNWLFLALFYIAFVSPIRIYFFHENKIVVKAPFKIKKNEIEIQVPEIKQIVFIPTHNGPDYFLFKTTKQKQYKLPFYRNIFWNNHYDFAIRYFRQHQINLLKQKAFGKTEAYDLDKKNK